MKSRGLVVLMVLSSSLSAFAGHPGMTALDYLETASNTFVAYRVFASAGSAFQLEVQGRELNGTALWAFLGLYELPSLSRAHGKWVGLDYFGNAVVHVELPEYGTVADMRRGFPVAGGWFDWHLDSNVSDAPREWLVVGILAGRGVFTGNFTLWGDAGVTVVGRATGPAFYMTDRDEDFRGGLNVQLFNVQGFQPNVPRGGGLKVQAGPAAEKAIEHNLFGVFIGNTETRVQRIHFEGPGGQGAAGPCVCTGLLANGQWLWLDGLRSGTYKFQIDYQADVQVLGVNVHVIGADVPLP